MVIDNKITHIGFEPNEDIPLAPVLTFVAWVVCLAIGLLGFLLPYSRPHRPVKTPKSVKVERLIVELNSAPNISAENNRPAWAVLHLSRHHQRTPWRHHPLP